MLSPKSVYKPPNLQPDNVPMTPLEQLKNCVSLHDIAKLLGYKTKALSYILYIIPDKEKYTEFTIPKKNGGERKISSPVEKLKEVQSRLAELLNKCYEEIHRDIKHKNSLSHAFKKKHSIISNAEKHTNKLHVFNIDLKDFFPTIHFGRVCGFFMKNHHFELNERVSTIIAQISCHKKELPQGSPCSPVISNLIGHILDMRMVNLAKSAKCTYSRYADDLTFSTNNKKFPPKIAYTQNVESHEWHPGKALLKEIERSLFEVNDSKTSMSYKTGRQTATGLVVNQKVNIKREYYRRARSMCISLFNTGEFYLFTEANSALNENEIASPEEGQSEGKEQKINKGTLAQLDGILSHIYHVKRHHDDRDYGARRENPTAIAKLYRKFLFYKHFYALKHPLIICEGKTDIIYIKCALRQLFSEYGSLITKNDGMFDYHVSFLRFSKNFKDVLSISEGTPGLRSIMEMYSKYMKPFRTKGKSMPVIILTDNDDGVNDIFKKTLKEKDRNKPFYQYIENLYIVPTPRTSKDKDTMIEDFFDKKTLSVKLKGKRFVPKDDFDKENEYGKRIFAEAVVARHQDKIDFTKFRKILDRLCAAIKDYDLKNNPK